LAQLRLGQLGLAPQGGRLPAREVGGAVVVLEVHEGHGGGEAQEEGDDCVGQGAAVLVVELDG